MTSSTFNLTPEQLVIFQECLSSKVCIRIFQTLLRKRALNISAISRKVGCTNNDCLEHLKKLTMLGIIEEEFYAGRHSFTIKKGNFTELMEQAIKTKEERCNPNNSSKSLLVKMTNPKI